MHFFHKFNIGSLKIGDYLGIPNFSLWYQTIFVLFWFHYFLLNCVSSLVAALGAIFSATDSVCTLQVCIVLTLLKLCSCCSFKNDTWIKSKLSMQVLNQDETPLLYSLVFGEGMVNDATSVVLFNAIQSFDLSHINTSTALQFIGNFLYLFAASTILGVVVSPSLSLSLLPPPLKKNKKKKKMQTYLCLWYDPSFYFFLQAGLLSAYIIKKLYFGRFVRNSILLVFCLWYHEYDWLKAIRK